MKAKDGGFSLVEALVGISMLAIVLTATTPLFIGGLQSTSGLGGQQVAVTVASQQLEYIRSVQPAGLISGRSSADVAALNNAPGLVDLTYDNLTTGNSDPTATAGSPSAVVQPTSSTTVASTTYTIRNFINVCYLSKTNGTCTRDTANGPAAYRVSVDVSWPQRGGVRCQSSVSGQCEYVATTIIDASKDPTFATTASPTITSVIDTATALPVSVHPGQQVTVVLNGTNFAYGATVTSSQGDVFGSTISNTGTTLTLPFTASSTVGSRTITVTNPNGTSGYLIIGPASVVKSTPNAISLTPGAAVLTVTKTFTLTGTDFFATPTTAAGTVQPTVTLVSRDILGNTVSATVSNVKVISSTKLTFDATFSLSVLGIGTLTLTNPDGGRDTLTYLVVLTLL